ncbi:MAG: hypothetical protein R3F59_26780 [Myxococcota bacterium]
MRWVWVLGLAGCLPADDRNVCEQAGLLLQRCGVSMPLVSEGPCVGARIAAAECVLEHVSDCSGLVTLPERIDGCLLDYVDDRDGGTVTGTLGTLPPGGLPAVEPTFEDTDAACADGVDNDQDGFTDCADAECRALGVCDTGF